MKRFKDMIPTIIGIILMLALLWWCAYRFSKNDQDEPVDDGYAPEFPTDQEIQELELK